MVMSISARSWVVVWLWMIFFFKQKTAYEMRISDWSSTCALPIFHLLGVYLAIQRVDGDVLQRPNRAHQFQEGRSEERREGKSVSVRVDLGGRRIIKNKKTVDMSDTGQQVIHTYASNYNDTYIL